MPLGGGERRPDGVTLILESSPLTKFLYPFDFTVLMNYNLQGNTASLSMTVINEAMFRCPSALAIILLCGLCSGECGL